MINLKIHCDIDASALAVQSSAAEDLVREIRQNEMAGWLSLPEEHDKDEFSRIKSAAKEIIAAPRYVVCIGIVGSYLGHRAVINDLKSQTKSKVKILYAGNNISGIELDNILFELGDDDFSINIISKSGTTTEPAIAFRILKQKLVEKYGDEKANARIYATTDGNNGALHDEALYNHYERFVV